MLVEHHMDLVMAVCDASSVLDFGRVIAGGTPDRGAATTRAVLDAYLGEAVPQVDADASRGPGCRVVRPGARARRRRASTAPAGQITAVLGANGAGKTTLLRTISGLRPAARGQRPARRPRASTRAAPEGIARLGIAHVPEGRGVIAELTVEENLRLGGLWPRRPGARRAARPGLRPVPARCASAAAAAAARCFGRRAADARDRPGADGRAASCCCSTSRRSAWRPRVAAQIFALLRELARATG